MLHARYGLRQFICGYTEFLTLCNASPHSDGVKRRRSYFRVFLFANRKRYRRAVRHIVSHVANLTNSVEYLSPKWLKVGEFFLFLDKLQDRVVNKLGSDVQTVRCEIDRLRYVTRLGKIQDFIQQSAQCQLQFCPHPEERRRGSVQALVLALENLMLGRRLFPLRLCQRVQKILRQRRLALVELNNFRVVVRQEFLSILLLDAKQSRYLSFLIPQNKWHSAAEVKAQLPIRCLGNHAEHGDDIS